ncbi:hypothetical protein MMC28_003209 [Mycoblastus sanguinarius]|nr:hypothetical protein [Mycoblastus sanguinarius]
MKNEIKECKYTFPFYDGVSVVGFTCHVGPRTITGLVKENTKAKEIYNEAVERGETAALLEQGTTSDVFITSLGNIAPGETLMVKITYIGELKHDIGADGIRFTIPTKISPRYGQVEEKSDISVESTGGIAITVDISMAEDSPLKEVRSPSHPIAVTLGKTSKAGSETSSMSRASATLSLGTCALDKDFVLEIKHENSGKPKALLETHSSIEGQRALMATLVPESPTLQSKPEVIFVADQSGSMAGGRTLTLVAALKIFLKSLPVGIKFNICLFGSGYTFLFPKSQTYGQDTLAKALKFLQGLDGKHGGTETLGAVQATIESRDPEENLSVILATDGDIWQQQQLFDYLNDAVSSSKKALRIFALGIGNSVSSALIEGVARAGNGFAQSVGEGEKQDSKVIRMLRGALTPDNGTYTLEVQYEKGDDGDDEYVLVERVTDSLRVMTIDRDANKQQGQELAAAAAGNGKENVHVSDSDGQRRYDYLPPVAAPKLLQTPQNIPPLYPFSRTTVYILISPEATHGTPKAVILRGSSPKNPFEMEIPVEVLRQPSETIHQLAAKKVISELEEGRGWLVHAIDENDRFIKAKHPAHFEAIVEREAVRLGVQYQIAGKYTSFVAVDSNQVSMNVAQVHEIQAASAVVPQSQPYVRYCASSNFASSNFAVEQTMRGMTPRKQLASKGARRVAPLLLSSGSDLKKRKMTGRGSATLGGAMRHPMVGNACFDYDGEADMIDYSEEDAEVEKETDETDPLQKLIGLQTFEGYWVLNPAILEIVGVSEQHKVPEGAELKVWATILAIAFLEKKLGREKESWEMIVEKARGWLGGQGVEEGRKDVDGWRKWAEQLVVGAT